MQVLASKYCLVFIIIVVVLLSFRFGGEHKTTEKFEQAPCSGAYRTQNFTKPETSTKNEATNRNLITNCDIRGIEQINSQNTPKSHDIIMDAIRDEHLNYSYSAGQLYTLAVVESSIPGARRPFSYLCFLAINIPENAIHKGTVIAKYKKSTSSQISTDAKNICFKVVAYRQSSYLRGIEQIQAEKIRTDWNLQEFADRNKLFVL